MRGVRASVISDGGSEKHAGRVYAAQHASVVNIEPGGRMLTSLEVLLALVSKLCVKLLFSRSDLELARAI